jgi:protein ImuA
MAAEGHLSLKKPAHLKQINPPQASLSRATPSKQAPSAEQAASLKQTIAAIEAACLSGKAQHGKTRSARVHVDTGLPEMDEALGGGIARATIHEIMPRSVQDLGAAAGFAFGVAARAQETSAHTLYIQHDFTSAETGRPYLPGLRLSGFDTSSLIYLHVPQAEDVLWAMNEALKCRAFSSVIAEFPAHTRVLDLTSTRRLALAAQEGLGLGLILRHAATIEPNAATTRWLVSSAPSRGSEHGGMGAPNFHLDLVKNRFGTSGQWQVEWHAHERKFEHAHKAGTPLSGNLVQPSVYRPDRARARATAV